MHKPATELGPASVNLLLQARPPLPQHGTPASQRGRPCGEVEPFVPRSPEDLDPLSAQVFPLAKSGLLQLHLEHVEYKSVHLFFWRGVLRLGFVMSVNRNIATCTWTRERPPKPHEGVANPWG